MLFPMARQGELLTRRRRHRAQNRAAGRQKIMSQSLTEREPAMRKTVVTMLFLTGFGVAHAGDPIAAGAEARDRAPLSIAVDGAKGASFRLVYKSGNGWQFADHSATKLVSAAQQEGPTG